MLYKSFFLRIAIETELAPDFFRKEFATVSIEWYTELSKLFLLDFDFF
jgi:hypothetical protein